MCILRIVIYPVVVMVFAVLTASLGASQTETGKGICSKIVGGCMASVLRWPAYAAIRKAAPDESVSFYFCGGTAIATRWVLTAAHCLPDFVASTDGPLRDSKGFLHSGRLQVVIGAEDLREVRPNQVFGVDRVVIREAYRAGIDAALKLSSPKAREEALATIAMQVGNDIALLHLDREWTGGLAELSLGADSEPAAGAQVRVAGFGKTEDGKYKKSLDRFDRGDRKGELYAGSASLLEAALPIVATPQCAKRYEGTTIGAGQICAGLEQGGRDSCQGDSGGPLVAYDEGGRPRQIGLVSWGEGCAESQAYGVYTRISQHADWIQSHVGPLKGASMLNARSGLTLAELSQALAQLEAALGPTKGHVRLGVRGGNKVRLGGKVVFEASSNISGRLIILDIDAGRQVTLIYPNIYIVHGETGRILPGKAIAVPGPDYPGFTAFEAREPIGKGHLIALVAPESFDIERFAAGLQRQGKGFTPINDAPNYLMQVIRHIETFLELNSRSNDVSGTILGRWGYAVTEYEIIP